MTEQAWLNQLKVSDEVVILSGGFGTFDSISTIVRMSKTLFFTGTGQKFRITDGRSPGSGYYHASLIEPTKERTDEIRRDNLARLLRRVEWKTLPFETLRAVYRLVKST